MMTDEEEEKEVNGTKIQTRWERVRPPRRRSGRHPRSWRQGGGRSPGPPLEMRCPQGLQGAHNLLEEECNVTCCLKFCLRTRAEDKHTKDSGSCTSHEWCRPLGGSRPSLPPRKSPSAPLSPPQPRLQTLQPRGGQRGLRPVPSA